MRSMPIHIGAMGYRYVGRQPQPLVDDFLIEHMENLAWVVNQPTKEPVNPVLTFDKPWEAENVWLHGNVLYDQEDRLFKMWYQTWRWPGPGRWSGPPNEQFVCYALSQDGVRWEKPALEIVPYGRESATNILLRNPDPNICLFHRSVVKDYLDTDPERLYKMMVYMLPPKGGLPAQEGTSPPAAGIYVAFSADGIHWTDPLEYRLPVDSHDTPNLFFDARRGRWFVPTKYHAQMPSITSSPGRRSRGISMSDSFQEWTFPVSILEPDAVDPPDTEFYHKEILCIYDNLYIAGLGVYHTDPDQDTMDIQLVTSRDGIQWRRAGERQVFLPVGPPGSFDSHMIMELASGTLLIDDELWIYYTGANDKHYAQHQGAIGLARLPRDRFIALDSGNALGSMVTRPLVFEGSQLQLNLVALNGGEVRVEIQSPSGDTIPGYGFADCRPCYGDQLQYVVEWREGTDLAHLQGQVVRLGFRIERARLYAFQFAG